MSRSDASPEREASPKERRLRAAYEMLYLCRCALYDRTPAADTVSAMDLDELWEICGYHSLTAMVAMALERAGISDQRFVGAKAQVMRKEIILQAEYAKLSAFMEAQGIAHMVLKGAILKELYPKTGMRQMSDMDVLFDPAYRDAVYSYMTSSGYTGECKENSHHDAYEKLPVSRFELHSALFGSTAPPQLREYYDRIWDRLLLEPGKRHTYRFTDEDFYLYMTAHEYKHFVSGGTGLRSLVDRAVFLQQKGSTLCFDAIDREAEAAGIADYERQVRKLTLDVFEGFDEARDPEALSITAEQREQLLFFLSAGTYGNIRIYTENRVERYLSEEKNASKLGFIMRRIFPNLEFYRRYYPFYYRHKLLLPVAWFKRIFRILTTKRRSRALHELKIVHRYRRDPSKTHKDR